MVGKYFNGCVAVCAALTFTAFGAAPASAAEDDLSVKAEGSLTSVEISITNGSDQDVTCYFFGVAAGTPTAGSGADDPAFDLGAAGYRPGKHELTARDVPVGSYDVHYECNRSTAAGVEIWTTSEESLPVEITRWSRDPIPVTVGEDPTGTGSCFGSVCF